MKTEYQKCMDGEFFTADSEMLQIVYLLLVDYQYYTL